MGRVISTAIQFIDGFTKPSKEVIKSMQSMANNIDKSAKQIQSAGKAISSVGTTLTAAITVPIASVATAAVKTAADFESSMSQVAATMGKTKDEVKNLSELAQQMGATTAFSASEAAEGINVLAMAGLDATQITDSLGTVLDLAAAGAIDMGSSASYVVGAVKGFSDEMKNAATYADYIAKGATLANTDVAQFGEAISSGAATAAGYGQTLDELTLSLLRMAEQNVTGSEAVIGLNAMMKNLYASTPQAKKALEALGVSAYDTFGAAKDVNTVVDELSEALKEMSDESATAYKSVIFTEIGMKTFNKMTTTTSETLEKFKKGLSEATGSAATQAKTQLDNLNGQITLLKSAIEGIAITIGDKLLPYIKIAVSWFQKAADYINNLSDAQVNNIMKWAGIVAVIPPIIMVFGKIVTTVGTVQRTWAKAIKIFAKFKGVAGLITSPAGIVIGVLAAIAVAAVLIIKNWDQVKGFLQNVGNWFKNAFEKAGFSTEDFKSKFTSIGNTVGSIAGKIIGFAKNITGIFKKEFAGSISEGATEAGGALEIIVGGAVTAFDGVVTAVDKGLQAFEALLEFFSGAFIGNWNSATQGFRNSIKNIFSQDIATDLIKVFDSLLPSIKAVVSGIKTTFNGLVEDVKKIFNGFTMIFKGIGTMLKGIFGGDIESALKGFQTVAEGIIDTVGNVFKTKIHAIKNFVVGAFSTFLPESVVNKIAGTFDLVISTWDIVIVVAKSCVSGVLTIFDGLTTFISGVFTGNWRKAWEGIKTIFKGVFDSLAALCKAPMNAVIGIINGAISGINKLNVTIPEWVPGLGGKSFGINLPTIPMLYKGTNNWQGGAAVINDRGGEIVDLPQGTRVYPHDKSVEMARNDGAAQSSGSISINIQKLADKIEVRSDDDIDKIAEALAIKLKKVAFNTA